MGLKASKQTAGESFTVEEVARRPKLSSSEVPALHLVSHTTYALLSALVYNDAQKEVKCPEGWEVFLDCASLQLDREGYYAVAYVHRAAKHCVIAQRGTSEVLALRAGVWVYFEEPTIQFYLAEQFSKQVALSLSLMQDAEEWVVSYTGHSLGAVLAACRAVEEGTFAVTFESPGSRAFLQKTSKGNTSAMDASIIAYLRPPNPINTLKPHCGYIVMLPATNPDGTPLAASNRSTSGSATSLMILPPTGESPPELAARSPIMSELPKEKAAPTSFDKKTNTAHSVAKSAAAAPPALTAGSAGPSATRTTNALSRFNPTNFKLPSIRPQGYLRDYVLGGAGLGIPELQQYVSKVEPMIREMLERTQQLHSIHGIVSHFDRGVKAEGGSGAREAQEKVVLRWPSHLMQFMEYHNTTRALDDPYNQAVYVNAAYEAMLQRIYAVAPIPTDTIPLRFIDSRSQKLVRLWWSWDAVRRKALPLSRLEHKALNCIKMDGGALRVTVLKPFEAKQFLALLVKRPHMAPILSRVWPVEKDGSTEGVDSVVTSHL